MTHEHWMQLAINAAREGIAKGQSPFGAVVVRDGFSYVYRVSADHRVNQQKVQTGRVVGDQVEIQTGVKPEDRLVTSGGSFLSDGDLVRVVEAVKPGTSGQKTAVTPVKPAQAAIKKVAKVIRKIKT